jgi:mercuric ion transport protein
VFSVGHRGILLAIGALGLIGGAALLWRQQRVAASCDPNGVCTSPSVRILTLIGLVIGAGLLWAG